MVQITINGNQYNLPNLLNPFQLEMYIKLINWKWLNVTKVRGSYRGNDYDAIIPTHHNFQNYPLYQPIVSTFINHKQKFPFRSHKFIGHMASSQAACANLFLPLMQDPKIAATVLNKIKPDLKSIDTKEFDNGFRIEFWDDKNNSLNDHNNSTGTDVDFAIAYRDQEDNLNLWLIEHKLTESEFTTCGGARSKGRTSAHNCSNLANVQANNNLCYYHNVCKYNYWLITNKYPSLYPHLSSYKTCPFKGGMNQLWRNQLMAIEIENAPNWKYKKVYFSVVYHPLNTYLSPTLNEYEGLINNSGRFFHFTSDMILNAADQINDPCIRDWVYWYRSLYY